MILVKVVSVKLGGEKGDLRGLWCNGKEENTASGSRFFKMYGCKGKQLTASREITGCRDAFFFFLNMG